MKRVDRHKVVREDATELAREFEEHLRESARRLREDRDSVTRLGYFRDEGETLASFGALARIEPARVVYGLRVAAEAGAALFELAAHPAERVRAPIGGDEYDLFVPAQHTMAAPGVWQSGFYSALASRCRRALDTLTAVAPATLNLARSSVRALDYQWELVPALSALARHIPEARDALERALAQASADVGSEHAEYQPKNAAQIELALRLAEGDEDRFNAALEAALVAHRAFYSADEERRDDPSGFLALGPLGLACLAHDRGMRVDVESDYIPAWIIQRTWNG